MNLKIIIGGLIFLGCSLSTHAGYRYFETDAEVEQVRKEEKCSEDKELCRQMGVIHVLSFAVSCSERLADIAKLDEEQRENELEEIVALSEKWKPMEDEDLKESFVVNAGLVESLIAEQVEYLAMKDEKFVKDFCKFKEVLENQEDPEAYSGLKP